VCNKCHVTFTILSKVKLLLCTYYLNGLSDRQHPQSACIIHGTYFTRWAVPTQVTLNCVNTSIVNSKWCPINLNNKHIKTVAVDRGQILSLYKIVTHTVSIQLFHFVTTYYHYKIVTHTVSKQLLHFITAIQRNSAHKYQPNKKKQPYWVNFVRFKSTVIL
jgi:hypothetical protein